MVIASLKPEYSAQQIADQLTTYGWAYYDDVPQRFDVETGGTIKVNISGLNKAGKMFARAAFDAWSTASGLTFQYVLDGEDILFFDDGSDEAYSYSELNSEGIITYSEVVISRDWINYDWKWVQGEVQVDYASYSYQTYLHEIGHALGLAHAGNYDAGDSSASGDEFESDAHFRNDSWQMTVMSYFAQTENPNVDADYAYVMTPMMADLIAIHDIYGRPDLANSGDTVYGYSQNLGGMWDDMDLNASLVSVTIFDTDGVDTLDLSQSYWDQTLYLKPGTISDAGGLKGNLIIEGETVLENAYGGFANDYIEGNNVDNVITGGQGHDSIYGEGGADTIIDGMGDNTLNGGDDDDFILAYAGGNEISGDDGSDILIGGINRDGLSGGAGDDILIGDGRAKSFGAADTLEGGADNDLMMGGKGADHFVFKPNSGQDVIAKIDVSGLTLETDEFTRIGADFEVGRDKIVLTDFGDYSVATIRNNITQGEDGAVFSYRGTEITFWGVDAADLSTDDFIWQ